jgi:hypothetical protein
MAKTDLTAQTLRELLHYDQDSGALTWRVNRPPRGFKGEVAGCVMRNGYRAISFGGKRQYAHRIAWVITYGCWPDAHIDHINGDPLDNRIANLRDVSATVNMQNLRSQPRGAETKLFGATFSKEKGCYLSRIKVYGKFVYLGRFTTAEDAHAAYIEAKRRLHVGCTI